MRHRPRAKQKKTLRNIMFIKKEKDKKQDATRQRSDLVLAVPSLWEFQVVGRRKYRGRKAAAELTGMKE